MISDEAAWSQAATVDIWQLHGWALAQLRRNTVQWQG